MSDPVTFLASFKPIQSAVRLDGQGDGGEMVLTFDRSQMAEAVQAWARFSGGIMRVTFEPEQPRSKRKR